MNRTFTRRPRDAGASAVEYAGLIVLAALIIGSLTFLIGGDSFTRPIRTALCHIFHQQNCGRIAPPGANGNGPGRSPARRPLTQADYKQQLCRQLRLGCESWQRDTSLGVSCNDWRIQQGYHFYQQIFDRHPEVRWAGLAKLAGDTVYGGMQDIHVLRGMTRDERIRWLAKYATHLPKWVIDALANLSERELDFYEVKLEQMQRKIFVDLGWQLSAYDRGGIAEMRRLKAAGQLDKTMLRAWENIASGDPRRISQGNQDLALREQRDILQPFYDEMLAHPGGKAATYLFSLTAGTPVPGSQSFREYKTRPRETKLPGGIVIRHRPLLPDGDVANFPDRWDWLTHNVIPQYNKLLREDPQGIKKAIDAPLGDKAEEFRILPPEYFPYNSKDGVC